MKFFEATTTDLFEEAGSLFTESMGTDDGRRILIGWVMPGVSPGYNGPFNFTCDDGSQVSERSEVV